jgi:hypothetical protein
MDFVGPAKSKFQFVKVERFRRPAPGAPSGLVPFSQSLAESLDLDDERADCFDRAFDVEIERGAEMRQRTM